MSETLGVGAVDGALTQLSKLAEQTAELRDLFERRLLEDKAKNRLYEELFGQLELARDGLSNQVVAPLLSEVLLVIDRIAALGQEDDELLESVRTELQEIVERRGVYPIPTLDSFDPAVHEVIRTVDDPQSAPGSIVKVVRPGYRLGTSLLRPERVVVVAERTRRDRSSTVTGQGQSSLGLESRTPQLGEATPP